MTTTDPAAPPCAPRVTINHLPLELFHQIFFYLRPQDFDAVRHVSRRWFQMSLYRPLILHHLAALVESAVCPCHRMTIQTCPDFTSVSTESEAESSESLKLLCAAFSKNVAVWPGSRHRLACNRLELDTKAIRASGGGIIEHICFSKGGGTFVGIVTRVGGRNEAGRKLWVNRLFSFRHSTYGYRPRGAFGELCVKDVEVSRCIPGMLYMTMELKGKSDVMSVEIIEHSLFSAVKRIIVRFVDGKETVTNFTEFQPVVQSVRNHLGTKFTRFLDIGDETFKTCDEMGETEGRLARTSQNSPHIPALKKKIQYILAPKKWKKKPRVLEPLPVEIPPVPTHQSALAERVLIKASDAPEKQLCHSMTVPVDRNGRGYRLIVTPAQELLLTYIQSSVCDSSTISIAYRLRPPDRLTNCPGRIRHVTLSPSHFFDWGSRVWWACVAAAYENGEIWMWRFDTSKLETIEDMAAERVPLCTPTPPAPVHSSSSSTTIKIPVGPPQTSAPREPIMSLRHQDPIQVLETAVSSTFTTAHTPQIAQSPESIDENAEALAPRHPILPSEPPPSSAPISLSPSALNISRDEVSHVKSLALVGPNITPPQSALLSGVIRDLQAWRVGWEPSPILKMEFVGKGQTLLMATEETVTIVEFRVRWGVERVALRARY